LSFGCGIVGMCGGRRMVLDDGWVGVIYGGRRSGGFEVEVKVEDQ
jgi:hypothetical protein